MRETEGVIKYQLSHQTLPLPDDDDITLLNAWRSILFRLGLIGQIADKYAGLSFGNISRRAGAGGGRFLITGTQTGHMARLDRAHYTLITGAYPKQNRIESIGLTPPSSEALSHASFYQNNADILVVIHVHSPEIWRNSRLLKIKCIDPVIPYGTPEMARAIDELFSSGQVSDRGLISMLGHEDGVIAFGPAFDGAANLLISKLAEAIWLEQK
ncbi:MAG: class II aldolase/adducin family protein [Methylomonas sp.]|jgi:hypothetical protein